MKSAKTILTIILIFIICFCFMACSGIVNEPSSPNDNKDNIDKTPPSNNNGGTGSSIVITPGHNGNENSNNNGNSETENNENSNSNNETPNQPENPTPNNPNENPPSNPPQENDTQENEIHFYIIYHLDGGINNSSNPDTCTNLTETFSLEAPTKNGYAFEGWFDDDLYSNEIIEIKKGTKEDVSLFAKWSPLSGIEYKIEHYKETLNGTFTKDKTDKKYATMGEIVQAEPIEYTGFSFDVNNSRNKVSSSIKADGSLTLKLYYTRNMYSPNITLLNCKIVQPSDYKESSTFKYGQVLTFRAQANEGWTFEDGSDGMGATITIDGTNNLVFEATKKAPIYVTPQMTQISTSNAAKLSRTEKNTYRNYFNKVSEGFVVPGLEQYFVPQAITYWNEKNLMLISGYFNAGTSGASYPETSVIMTVDLSTGNLVGQYYLYNANGSAHATHDGGIAVTETNVFLSNGSKLHKIPLDSFFDGKTSAKIYITETISVATKASYCSYSNGILWVGDFHIQGNSSYDTLNHDELTNPDDSSNTYAAWIAGYNLTNGDFTTTSPTPNYIFAVKDKIQGISIDTTKNKIVLSKSYGRKNDSTLYIYNNPLTLGTTADTQVNIDGQNIDVWFLDSTFNEQEITMPPLSEGVYCMNGKAYIIFESGALLYKDGLDGSGNGTYPQQVINIYTLS